MNAAASVVVAVLAGGRGRRIGGDKAAVRLHGRPLISYPLQAARDAGLPALVVAKPGSALPELDVPVLREPAGPVHPLCGVVAALRTSAAVLAVGCDMPFVTAGLLACLAAVDADCAVAELEGSLQPLPALYRRSTLEALEQGLAAQRPLREVVAGLRPHVVEEAAAGGLGDPRRLLFSVNDRHDLQRAASWTAPGRAGRSHP